MAIGTIKDWVFDLSVERITYVVGALDHLVESNNKLFVIPWETVKVHPEANTFLLIGDASVLKNAPSLALDAWPNLPTSQWSAAVDAYWQERLGARFAAVRDPAAMSKVSDLFSMTIKNFAGQDVGPIKELAFDPQRGLIAYVVLSCEEVGARNRLVFFAIPWHLVQVNLVQHTFYC
jgi:sporulation protein YlmC with PRC-barrel domain